MRKKRLLRQLSTVIIPDPQVSITDLKCIEYACLLDIVVKVYWQFTSNNPKYKIPTTCSSLFTMDKIVAETIKIISILTMGYGVVAACQKDYFRLKKFKFFFVVYMVVEYCSLLFIVVQACVSSCSQIRPAKRVLKATGLFVCGTFFMILYCFAWNYYLNKALEYLRLRVIAGDGGRKGKKGYQIVVNQPTGGDGDEGEEEKRLDGGRNYDENEKLPTSSERARLFYGTFGGLGPRQEGRLGEPGGGDGRSKKSAVDVEFENNPLISKFQPSHDEDEFNIGDVGEGGLVVPGDEEEGAPLSQGVDATLYESMSLKPGSDSHEGLDKRRADKNDPKTLDDAIRRQNDVDGMAGSSPTQGNPKNHKYPKKDSNASQNPHQNTLCLTEPTETPSLKGNNIFNSLLLEARAPPPPQIKNERNDQEGNQTTEIEGAHINNSNNN